QPRRPQRVREIMPARLKLGRQTTIRDQRSAVRFEEAHKVTLSPDRLPLVPRQRSPTGYPSLALPTPQDSAAIVVRSGDPVQLRAGRQPQRPIPARSLGVRLGGGGHRRPPPARRPIVVGSTPASSAQRSMQTNTCEPVIDRPTGTDTEPRVSR